VFSQQKSSYNKIKIAVACLFLAFSAVFWNLAIPALSEADNEYGEVIQIRTGDRGITVGQVTDMLEKRDVLNEDFKYLAWSQTDGILRYYGDNHGIFSLIHQSGCAMSEKAAYDHFGTTVGIIGQDVTIDDERYIVERLLYGDSVSTILKVREEEKGTGFDVLNIVPGEGEKVSESALRMNFGVFSEITIVYGAVINFFGGLCKILLFAAVLAAVFCVLKAITAKRSLVLCGLLIAFAGCCLLMGTPGYIPDSFIPTRWSEFEFWSNTFNYYGKVINYYFSMKTYAPDIVFRALIVKSMILTLLSAVSLVIAGTLFGRILKERGIGIGFDNFKKHDEALCGESEGGGQ